MSKLGRLIGSRKYRALFPDVSGSFAATTIRSRRGGTITCSTVGQQISGRGADLIIVDDPLSPYHALDAGRRDAVNTWYDAEVRTRMNNRTSGAIVVIMQRVHPGDLCAHLRAREQFTLVSLPAIVSRDETVHFPSGRVYLRRAFEALQPARETVAQLEARLDEIGGFQFAGQYLQGHFRWEERTSRVEYLHPKRPQRWRPGDGPGETGGLYVLNVKDDIKAQYFRGYDIYEGLQKTNWMTPDEWMASAVIQQQALVDAHYA